jgi:hypothetical protein
MERTNNNMKMVYHDMNASLDSINSEEEYIGVVEVQSIVRNFVIKKYYAWEYTFLVFNKETGEMVFYQSQENLKKYTRKKAKKALDMSFKTLKTTFEEDDE